MQEQKKQSSGSRDALAAAAVMRMLAEGHSAEFIAKNLHKKPGWVNRVKQDAFDQIAGTRMKALEDRIAVFETRLRSLEQLVMSMRRNPSLIEKR